MSLILLINSHIRKKPIKSNRKRKKRNIQKWKKNSTTKKLNKLPQVAKKPLVLNNINYKIDNDQDVNIRNNRYYSLNHINNNIS